MPDIHSTTNLIINNIPSTISDDLLNKLFNQFGSIKSCKIIRVNEKDDKTFGFCEYNDSKAAKNALFHLDGYRINDRSLKVSYAKLFPKPKGKCIEVINLPKGTQEETIRKYFSQFGRISRLRLISNDLNNAQPKSAEIVFDNKHEAEKATQKSLIKWIYDNNKVTTVTVTMASPDRSYTNNDLSIHQSNPIPYGNVTSQASHLVDNYFYIQQRPQTAFTQNPFDLSQFGSVLSYGSLGSIYQNAMQLSPQSSGFYPAKPYSNYPFSPHYPAQVTQTIVDPNDKTSHSLAMFTNQSSSIPYSIIYPSYGTFINPANSLSVGIPLMYASPHPCKPPQTSQAPPDGTLNDKSINPKTDWYNRQQHQQQQRNTWVVYVYNIGNSTNGEQLRELFASKFDGDIVRVDVPKDLQSGANKNFGFITFKSYDSAQLAIDDMNGKEFQGKPLQVSFKK